jgi:rubrerythrin
MFERSLSDIRSTYEMSHQIINNDCRKLEEMAEEMKEHREFIDQQRRERNFPSVRKEESSGQIRIRDARDTDEDLDLD